jgi:hypothetical protein
MTVSAVPPPIWWEHPTSVGGVNVEWHLSDVRDIEVEFHHDGEMEALVVDGDDESAFPKGTDADAITEAVPFRVLVLASAVVGATLLSDFDSRWCRRGLGPVLLAVSMLGIYATVPDTEQALVLLGLALPLALTFWPWPVASLGVAGSLATTGLVVWTISAGGAGRTSSIIGGLACLGVLVLEPITRGLRADRRSALELVPLRLWWVVRPPLPTWWWCTWPPA